MRSRPIGPYPMDISTLTDFGTLLYLIELLYYLHVIDFDFNQGYVVEAIKRLQELKT
jgi:hypothetical protein